MGQVPDDYPVPAGYCTTRYYPDLAEYYFKIWPDPGSLWWFLQLSTITHAHTHTVTHTRLTAVCPGLPRWAGTRKVKPIWILLKQATVSGSGISWAICKSAPCSRQTTTPAPHHSVFTGRMPFLSPNQPCESTEGNSTSHNEMQSGYLCCDHLWCLTLASRMTNNCLFGASQGRADNSLLWDSLISRLTRHIVMYVWSTNQSINNHLIDKMT